MVSRKFRGDICNGSEVIVLADKQTDRQTDKRIRHPQTDTAENNTTLATLHGCKLTIDLLAVINRVKIEMKQIEIHQFLPECSDRKTSCRQ